MEKIFKLGIYGFLALALAVSTGLSASGQGRGHDQGGGRPQGHGGGQQQRAFDRGPQRQMQQQPAPQQMQRQQPRMERQQIARPQPRSMPNFQRQMPRPQTRIPQNRGWQDRGWSMPDRARMQQTRPQPQMRIERRPETRMPQQERQPRVDGRMDVGRTRERQQQPRIMRNDGARLDSGRFDQNRRAENNNNISPRDMQRSRDWRMQSGENRQFRAYNSRGRGTQARAFNFDQQQIRQQEGFWRQRSRDQGRRFDQGSFRRAYYRHREYRENVLRSVIANFFVGDRNSYSYLQPQYYDAYYYGTPYNPHYHSYDAGYYQPGYDYPSAPDYYSEYSDGYAYPEEFPIGYFTEPDAGNFYTASMYRDLLAYGYQEGYEDGLYARENRRYHVSYEDPFAFDDTVYDPYSYSLGENRRCLGEGYQLGYQDALAGGDYAPISHDSNVDLVSVLIGNALQLG
ncbi:MAG: hypothetical protein ABI878_02295 [Acidobacteriota bacterium]